MCTISIWLFKEETRLVGIQFKQQVVFWWWTPCHNSLVDNYAHNLLLIYSSIRLHIKSNFRHQNVQTFHFKAIFISIHRINFQIIFLHRQMMLWARYSFVTDLTSLNSKIICCYEKNFSIVGANFVMHKKIVIYCK